MFTEEELKKGESITLRDRVEPNKSLCCRQPIVEYPQYNLKVCSYCKSEIHVK